MSNFLQIAQRVRQECGLSGTGPAATTSQTGDYKRVVDWVNSAYLDIQNKWLDWKFLWAEDTDTLVLDQRDYDPPAGSSIMDEETFYLDGEYLTYVPFSEYRRDRDGWDEQTGTPDSFTILPNGKYRVIPTPDADADGLVMTFEYYKAGVVMAANADEPLIPDAYQDTIIWRAKWYWAVWDEAELEAQGASLLYEQAMKRLEAAQAPSMANEHGRAQNKPIEVRAF